MVSPAGDTEDDLTRMLRAVERIADGVGSVRELAIKLAPNAAPAARASLKPHEQAALDRLRLEVAHAQTALFAYTSLPLCTAEWLIGTIDRLTGKS